MDKNNPIIRLVNKGTELEKEKRVDDAQKLFVQAWNEATNDWEKCIAAHFVARHQTSPEESLKWNMESLTQANNVHEPIIRGYYPSLYLAVGTSYEKIGNVIEAKRYYQLAFERISDLPTDPENEHYSKGVRETILERKTALDQKMS